MKFLIDQIELELADDRSVCIVVPSSMWAEDRKSTRLNSSHRCISYAVFCLKKTNMKKHEQPK